MMHGIMNIKYYYYYHHHHHHHHQHYDHYLWLMSPTESKVKAIPVDLDRP
jgi:hypothetical protein